MQDRLHSLFRRRTNSVPLSGSKRRTSCKRKEPAGHFALGIIGGTQIKIIADGADEQAAVNALVELVESGFSEETR